MSGCKYNLFDQLAKKAKYWWQKGIPVVIDASDGRISQHAIWIDAETRQ